mmetsp:Transcript_22136/g.45191  ORF Transcript_22136/g.45191 Transcript_22136/m.45191 type:complete len:179 (+) Transcript_22136:137-673(+)
MPRVEEDESRKAHMPLLLWLMNNWTAVLPLLKTATAKLDPKNDTLILDVRTERGTPVAALDPAAVFHKATVAEYTAVRKVLTSHPFIYNARWCQPFSVEVKQHVKSKKGTAGVFCLFAFGDSPEHAPDQSKPVPDFFMNVALYNESDLQQIAEATWGADASRGLGPLINQQSLVGSSR